MKKNILLTIAFSLCTSWLTGQERPNIILFMADDLGWQDTSLPFWTEETSLNKRFHTPNMERLAKMGVRFTQAYAGSFDSPSRCSLMTGMNQARHRVTYETLEYNKASDKNDAYLNMPVWNMNGIQPVGGVENSSQATTFVQLLRNSGYHTILCGKAQFGATTTYGADPKALGFNISIGGQASGTPVQINGSNRFGFTANGTPSSIHAVPNLERYWERNVILTEALTQEAIRSLEMAQSMKAPFFLFLSHYAMHTPSLADPRFIDKYKKAGLSDIEAAYCSRVEGIDKSLGDIMDYLEKNNQLENTIIIFVSDNGGLAASNRTPPLHVQNAPLRSGKGSIYEGGIRVPMIAYWNDVTLPNSVNDKYLAIEDFFPSILEMAQVEIPQTIQQIDGVSFVPLLKGTGDPSQNRALYWNIPNNWTSSNMRTQGIGQSCAIREGDYKLIYWYKDGKKELYNLKNDISEDYNLALEQPEKVAELSQKLGNFLRSVNAQRPTEKFSQRTSAWPDDNHKNFADHWQFVKVILEEPGYHLWGSSPIWGEDGKVHLFVARWKVEHSFDPGWRSHSEIAHYVGDNPEGPFKFSDIVLQGTGTDTWDKYGIHNPNIHKVGDQYVLLYIGNNNYKQPPHPSNQKIGMMVSKSLYGPWEKVGKDGCILEPSDDPSNWTYNANNGVNNPTLLVHPSGKYYLYFKSNGYKMGVAIADQVEGPYTIQKDPVTKNETMIEDGYAFMMDNKFCLLTTDNHGIIKTGGGILWKSDNGTEFNYCEPGFHTMYEYLPESQLNNLRPIYGSIPKFERPQILMKNGKPAWLYVPSGVNIKGGNGTIVHLLKYIE